MAQLSDDCFAFGGPLLAVDDAVALIAERVAAVTETEWLALGELDGRVLAADVIAPLPLPPFTNSAVDGYALASADLPRAAAARVAVAGRIAAGETATAATAGEAVRIFTGAPMPPGLDTVFMQEDVTLQDDGTVLLPPGLKAGANVRPAGEDIAEGSVALAAGTLLRPQELALLAALGLTGAQVRRRIRVAVFSTGNEVAEPGQPRGPAQLYDSNRVMLGAMLRRLGCAVSDLGIVRDDAAQLAARLSEAAAGHDLILTSGGVSTGEEDHVKAAAERAGRLVLWRMAIKPGRPVAMGVIGGAALIGLPGNPVASFVTFAHVVRPAIAALAGARWQPPLALPVRAAFSYRKKAGRREYVRAHLQRAGDGAIEAVKFAREGAGLLSSLTRSDGLVELGEASTGVQPGDTVGFLSHATLL
jgi:molybdopterin molybdotransferase